MSRIVIVGAGPAGSAAAITARQAGADVLILEKARFPRFRPGETLHPGVEPLLERLGVSESICNAGYLRHEGTFMEWGSRKEFVPFGVDDTGAWRGFQAPREDFDQRLLWRAQELGADLRYDAPTSIRLDRSGRCSGVCTSSDEMDAAFVIDASGSDHWLARQLGIGLAKKSPRLVARYGYMEGELESGQPLPSISATESGWIWLAAIGADRYQWTFVTEPSERPHKSWLPEPWRKLRSCGSFGADVTWRIAERTAGEGWFSCGDAGAVLDPSSSHGVLRAIMSGMMAAHLACAVIAGKMPVADAASSYSEWFQGWFQHDSEAMVSAYKDAGLFGFHQPNSEMFLT